MRRILFALSLAFAVYTVLIYFQGRSTGKASASELVRVGMGVWQEQNCQSCHQFYGLGGYMGPDLTNITSKRDEQRIRTFIRYGTGRMPAHALSEDEIDALFAFLAWVDSSGTSRVPDTAVHWTGTYLINER